MKLFHSISKMFFTFLAIKTFLIECVRSSAASCNKKREFWHETHTPLWLLIGRIIFLTCEKTSFAILIARIIFFTCENHRSLLWLAITNLRTKIYDIAFWWVFLSMYIIIMFTRWKELSLIQKMNSILLSTGDATERVFNVSQLTPLSCALLQPYRGFKEHYSLFLIG